MFKKLRFEETHLSQKGTSEVEKMLAIMPKHCSCSACTNLKEEAKAKLGKNKYNVIANSLGLIH